MTTANRSSLIGRTLMAQAHAMARSRHGLVSASLEAPLDGSENSVKTAPHRLRRLTCEVVPDVFKAISLHAQCSKARQRKGVPSLPSHPPWEVRHKCTSPCSSFLERHCACSMPSGIVTERRLQLHQRSNAAEAPNQEERDETSEADRIV